MKSNDLLKEITYGSNYSLEEMGGKAFNLQFLINNGLPVPRTYFIDVQTMNEFAATGVVPFETFESLSDKYFYAARSSAVVEDGVNHSYAGMFNTYLNVTLEELPKQIMACKNSSRNLRLEYYERSLGLKGNNGDMAVIVQEMILPEFAGICFTINPVTNDRDQLVLEFASGIGEKVVSGDVTPITLFIRKSTGDILEIFSGQYPPAFIYTIYPVLINFQVLAGVIERLYDIPVDIEWACRGNEISILQTRPVIINRSTLRAAVMH